MTLYSSTIDTPVEPFTAIVDDDGVVLASGWTTDRDRLLRYVHTSLLRPHQQDDGSVDVVTRSELGKVTDAVRTYHDGELTSIDAIPVKQISTGFRSHAWDMLRTIPAGAPVSYGEFATMAGNPNAVRAAASACSHNAAALFVPCHRVIRSDGGLGGFGFGLPAKLWLLDHERGL